MIEKLLAKLNAKISNLNPIGGEPTLTQSDVAYLLSGLNQIQHLFAQSYYL